MSCINIYHPDYIKLLSEIDDSINPFELPTLIRLYQKMNNTDKIPSVSEIYEIDNRTKSQERISQIQDIQGFKEFVDKNNSISDISSLGKLQGDLMESEKGQIGVNKQQLLMLLGPTMYNKPLAQVAVKELLQNSFDAIKARMNITDNKETGNIDITVNYDNRTISIKDDGIGMTPDIVKNAFLSIGGTNKEGLDVSERSGGFGLAKVQFLLGSEYVKVITIRDGIKTSLEATAVQLYNDDFTINKEQTNEPNGSYVEVKIPESYTTPEGTKKEIEFPGRWRGDVEKYRAFDILDKPLIGNVNVSFTHVKNKKEYKRVVPIGENTTEETLPPLFSKIDFSWGSADLYMSTEKKERPNHRILSSGIYQFNYSFRFKYWEDIPYDIVVNIKPSVSSTSEQYPFNNQREGFKNTVTEDIKSLNNYLKKYASGEAEKDAKAVFSNITGLPKVDPNKVLTPEEREKLYADVEKTIAENKQRRIEQGLESAEEVRKIWKLVIDKEGVKDAETGKVEVSNEKNYGSSFKAEKEIEKVEAIETTNFNPALPQYHNNTNFDYLKIPGAAEFFSDFGSVVLEMVRFAGNELDYDYRKLKSEDEKFFAGVSIDKQYGGVHVRKIINAIFVNPLAFNVSSLEEAVGVALHVTIHEINHTTVSGEGANFTTALGILYGKIYATGKYGLYEGLFRSIYKKHFETFKQLKNEYDKSSTRNLSESFSGDQIKKSITGNVQRDVDDVSTGQSSTERYTGNQENNTKDKTGDVILSKLLDSQAEKDLAHKLAHRIGGPELASIGSPELYSQYLDTIFSDNKVTEIDDYLYNSILNQLEQENTIEKDCTGGGKLKAKKGLQTNFTRGGKWKIYEIFEGKSHKQGGIDINIKNNQISFTNKNGSIKAKYGLVISKDNPNTKVKVNQNNQIKEYDISSPEYKDLYNSGKLTNYDKNTDTYIATPLKEVEVIGKKQYDYQGCVSGLCNDLAERNKMSVANFRQLNNLYGNAWEINKNNYGQDVDFTDFKNLKEGDIINLSRDEFKTDKEKGIPSSNQHIGYISKIEEGVPYVRHYISNVGIKSDGKTPYGEYFEEPINNIKEKFIYKPTGARRIDYFKDIDSQPSNFKYDSGYKPNQIEQDFASIHIDKNKIQDKLKLTNSEYDEIAKIAYGIMGNESSFGRSSKTLYRMALPDVFQKAVKVGLDIKRNVDVYDDNLNNLSQGYSSTKESSLYNISSNDGSTDFNKLNKRIKQGDYDDIERTGNYLRAAFEELGLNPDNLENGANSGKAIMATLAWYKKRNPNATTDDLLKMYTGKKNITKYKESFDNYLKNINSNSDDNLEYSRKDKMYGELSNVFNKTYSTTKELRSNIVGVLRDFSPLPAQYDALIADVLQGKTTITEKSLSSSNIQQLKEIVRVNVSKNKFKLEYDDYQTSEDKNDDVGGGGETMKSIVKSFTNDAYILKTLLGQAAIVKVDDNIYDVIDSFDFNDKGKSFGLFDDLKKRGLSPYSIARSVGRNMGSYNKQGQQVKIRIKLD